MKTHYTGEKMWSAGFLHGYPLMIFLGILFSFLTVAYFWRRYRYSWEILQGLLIVVIPMSIVGAKFYTMLVENNWTNWYKLSGLSIYGALIFAVASGLIYLWFFRHAVDMRTALTIILPTILLGQAFGRWGNFFNHEVYGGIVDGDSLNWLGPIKQHMYIDGEYRAPLFLYESLLSLAGYFTIVWWLNRKAYFKPGATGALYMIWYGIERLILQTFRDTSKENTSYFGSSDVPVNLVVSILVIIGGLILFVWFQTFVKPFDKISKKIIEKLNVIFKKMAPHFIKAKLFILNKVFKKDIKIDKKEIEKKSLETSIKKTYQLINPIKPRRIFFFGKKVEYRHKYFLYWGAKVENRVKIWIPDHFPEKLSKRKLNKGTK